MTMFVRALNSARVNWLGILVLVAFAVWALLPGIVAAQGTASQPPVTAKPAQPPAKPASPPAAKPTAPDAAKPASPATAKPASPDAVKPEEPAAKPDASAAAAGPLTIASLAGVWDGVAQTPDGDIPVHMVLVHQDGKLTGSMDTQLGTLTVTGSALNGDVLELAFELQGSPGGLSGKVAGDKYEGSWSVDTQSGPFALTRVPAAGIKKQE
jgi:hypothetical protein